ncbi:hypothetical protein GGR57DRAFT_484154 [Xylariaceae sp. FL1272]|nr:hypothetical protein GGR57DRAFT_484154 [Xylariaceae sp. FL1272]
MGETGNRASTANKSCLPCRTHKVKCDAATNGLPCSRCTNKQCVNDCLLPVRKRRTQKRVLTPYITNNAGDILAASISNKPKDLNRSGQYSIAGGVGCQSPDQTESDLLYLSILNDAVPDNTGSSHASPSSHGRKDKESFTPSNCRWAKLPHLDDTDYGYLVQKGVFDLPSSHLLDALVQAYFHHVFPFVPVINRADFICGYKSGNCSLLLLRAMLTVASLHVPETVLSACGFTSRSAAQESFFSKARLLHDFAAEDDPLVIMQASIILCMIILDHPTDRDFSYWLHNAVRLATKIDLRNTCIREDKPPRVLKLYRGIWWALHFLDLFHSCVNSRRSRLLENIPGIRPWTEEDCEVEDILGDDFELLPTLTPLQKALPVIDCELSRIVGDCLSIVINKPQQDPRQLMKPLDMWRKTLSTQMHLDENNKTDVFYLNVQAMSYRFECILCRLVQRNNRQSQHTDWCEWAKKRLRSAILELDTIVMRVLASGTLQDFPIAFITTVTALLALHIKTALDPSETDLVRAMARISIGQAMLVLSQGKEIPAIRRALPIFEEILAKRNLYVNPPGTIDPTSGQSHPEHCGMADGHSSPVTRVNQVSFHDELYENSTWFDLDLSSFDFLDESQIG